MKNFWKDYGVNILRAVAYAFCGLIFILSARGFFEMIKTSSTQVSVEKFELASIVLDSETKGNFVLGYGAVGEAEYYVSYKVNEDSSKSLYKMKAQLTKIYETLKEGDTPYVEETRTSFGTLKEIKLYVPENTIQQVYDLSLEQLK